MRTVVISLKKNNHETWRIKRNLFRWKQNEIGKCLDVGLITKMWGCFLGLGNLSVQRLDLSYKLEVYGVEQGCNIAKMLF